MVNVNRVKMLIYSAILIITVVVASGTFSVEASKRNFTGNTIQTSIEVADLDMTLEYEGKELKGTLSDGSETGTGKNKKSGDKNVIPAVAGFVVIGIGSVLLIAGIIKDTRKIRKMNSLNERMNTHHNSDNNSDVKAKTN